MEPQRKPTGFGQKISSLPTHWRSLEPSFGEDVFSMENFLVTDQLRRSSSLHRKEAPAGGLIANVETDGRRTGHCW